MGEKADIIEQIRDKSNDYGIDVGWYGGGNSRSFRAVPPDFVILPSEIEEKSQIAHINNATLILEMFSNNYASQKNNKTVRIEKNEYEFYFKWKRIIERRINQLLYLKKHMSFANSKLAIETNLSELNRAQSKILEILNTAPEQFYIKSKEQKLDDFLQKYASVLLSRITEFFKCVENDDIAGKVIADMRYLVAVIFDSKNEDEEYKCSTVKYIDYLKKLGISYTAKACKECENDTCFIDYKYCLICGKRRI